MIGAAEREPSLRPNDAVRILLADALLLPTGLLTSAYLSRRLGPEGYGSFSLAIVVMSWFEWALVALLGRAAIKLIGEAREWRPVAQGLVGAYLLGGCLGCVALLALTAPLATLLHESSLAPHLALLALGLPLGALANAHRAILVAVGAFHRRARAIAGYWIARLVLIVALVEVGLSTPGALLGVVAAYAVELLLIGQLVWPRLAPRPELSFSRLWSYAAPLFLYAVSLRLYERLDLLALKALGSSTADAGLYAAAQNLALVPRLFIFSLASLVLSALTRLIRAGARDKAVQLGRTALHGTLLLLPIAAMSAGAASELVGLVFGPAFEPAGPLLAVLVFTAPSLAMVTIATSILTADSRPGQTLLLGVPLVPLAGAGHLVLIPLWGALGAAAVSTVVAAVGAGLTVFAVYRVWRIAPSVATLLRCLVVSVAVFALAVWWPTPGLLVLGKLATLVVLAAMGLAALGEGGLRELALVQGPRALRFRSFRRSGWP